MHVCLRGSTVQYTFNGIEWPAIGVTIHICINKHPVVLKLFGIPKYRSQTHLDSCIMWAHRHTVMGQFVFARNSKTRSFIWYIAVENVQLCIKFGARETGVDIERERETLLSQEKFPCLFNYRFVLSFFSHIQFPYFVCFGSALVCALDFVFFPSFSVSSI